MESRRPERGPLPPLALARDPAALVVASALVACAVWLAWSVWRSRDWPVINDASLFHYVALRVSQGAVPYRDVFDFQFPGTLLLHLAVIETIGPGDAAWRVFDLSVLGVAVLLLARFLRPFGRIAVLAGPVLFVTWHLGLGAWNTGQRDFVMCPLLLGAALATAVAVEGEPGSRARLLLAGACVGVATTIKPQAAVFAALLVPFVLAVRARPRAYGLASFVLGTAIAPVAAGLWLAHRGGAHAFGEIVREYLLGFHLEMEHQAVGPLLREWLTNRFSVPVVLAGGLAFAIGRQRGEATSRRALLAVGFVYGVFHIAVQQKGWSYHFYPAAFFGSAWAASAFSVFAPARGELPSSRFPIGFPRLARLAVVLLFARPLAALAPRVELQLAHPARTRAVEASTAALEVELRRIVPAGGKIQVLDAGVVGIGTLLRLRAVQPTRPTYAHPLYVGERSDYTARLRTEFLADLARDPPCAFVVFGYDTTTGTNELLARFPELGARIERDWKLAVDLGEHKVFVPVRG